MIPARQSVLHKCLIIFHLLCGSVPALIQSQLNCHPTNQNAPPLFAPDALTLKVRVTFPAFITDSGWEYLPSVPSTSPVRRLELADEAALALFERKIPAVGQFQIMRAINHGALILN